MTKCPNCNSNKIMVKYDRFLECKSCGQHFYGTYEPEPETVDEELVEQVLSFPEPAVEPPKAKPAVKSTTVKKQVGKPAVKKAVNK